MIKQTTAAVLKCHLWTFPLWSRMLYWPLSYTGSMSLWLDDLPQSSFIWSSERYIAYEEAIWGRIFYKRDKSRPQELLRRMKSLLHSFPHPWPLNVNGTQAELSSNRHSHNIIPLNRNAGTEYCWKLHHSPHPPPFLRSHTLCFRSLFQAYCTTSSCHRLILRCCAIELRLVTKFIHLFSMCNHNHHPHDPL